jgi:hypothetical protein
MRPRADSEVGGLERIVFMRMVPRIMLMAVVLAASPAAVAPAAPAAPAVDAAAEPPIDAVLDELNRHSSMLASAENKSYEVLFDAFLELEPPPLPVGHEFNLTTIHPKMKDWAKVAGWAESNPAMAEAFLKCKDRVILGLPYGAENVKSEYREARLVAAIGVGGSLRHNEFRYLDAVEIMSAYVTAECYRRLEARRASAALDLALAHLFVLRQACDRQFLEEKLYAISMLSESLGNLRDMFYSYQDAIDAEQFSRLAISEIPFLRPDRKRLEMPEGDRVVSAALIRGVFDARGQADPERFSDVFAKMQSTSLPLTHFGAARRWRMIAEVHGSLDASLERLRLVYDDWWRRWRIQEYDPLLELKTQFERTNPVRYAAVISSMQNIEELFGYRNALIANVNGTALAAGLCAYKRRYGTYPRDIEMAYTESVRKRSDADPFERGYGPFRYRLLDARHAVDVGAQRLWVEPGQALLYSRGADLEDGRAERHSDDALEGDLVLWPPMRALQRAAGLLP